MYRVGCFIIINCVIKVLSEDRLKIRPRVSDRVKRGFGCGKLHLRSDEHGVFIRV